MGPLWTDGKEGLLRLDPLPRRARTSAEPDIAERSAEPPRADVLELESRRPSGGFVARPRSAAAQLDAGIGRRPKIDVRCREASVAVGIAGAATLGVGGAVAGAVAAASPLGPSLHTHLFPRNQPLDAIPIIMAHNTGSEPGSGSLPMLASSQALSFDALLRRTPVRAFELDLHLRRGEILVNHGGLYDRTVASPLRFDEVVEVLDRWLREPEHTHELVVLMFESYLDVERSDTLFASLERTFGDRLYTPRAHAELFRLEGRWPTIDELTAHGPRVMVISDRLGSVAQVPFSKREILKAFSQHLWEDRTWIGRLGHAINAEIPRPIDTTRMDALVSESGIFKLDQVTPEDPRLVEPEDRGALALHPDISILDSVYIADDTARLTAFVAGVFGAAGVGFMSVASTILAAVAIERLLGRVGEHLEARLAALDVIEILAIRDSSRELEDDLSARLSRALLSDVTRHTVRAGVTASVGLSGACVTMGLLFPVAYTVLSSLGLGLLIVGLSSTAAVTSANRRRLSARLAEALASPRFRQRLADACNRVRAMAAGPGVALGLERVQSSVERWHRLGRVSERLLWVSLILRVSSMAKYAFGVLGRISWLATSVTLLAASAIDAALAHVRRHRGLRSEAELADELMRTDLTGKPLVFFGKSPLERFVSDRRAAVAERLGLEATASTASILGALADPARAPIDRVVRAEAAIAHQRSELERWTKKDAQAAVFSSRERLQRALSQMIAEKASRRARREVFRRGVGLSLQVVALVGGASLLFPAVTAMVFSGAVGTLVLSLAVTAVVALYEGRVFRRHLAAAFEETSDLEASNALGSFLAFWTRALMSAQPR